MLVDYARTELQAAGLFDKDSDYDGMLGDAVMELIEKFAAQGHSGSSAARTASLFMRLAQRKPLGPLTGAEDEWTKVGRDLWQNKRCPNVFKDAGGRAYDIEGIVFELPNGNRYLGAKSRVYVTFPYTPHSEIVKVDDEGEPVTSPPYLVYGSDLNGQFRAACAASAMKPVEAAEAVGRMAARGETIHTFRDAAAYKAWLAGLGA